MNYYNPYFTAYPFAASVGTRTGLFSRLFRGINMSSILSGTQKTLNIVNQTIPLIKQAQPILRNAKTMFRVMNEFKKVDTPISAQKSTNNKTDVIKEDSLKKETTQYVSNSNYGPTFFA